MCLSFKHIYRYFSFTFSKNTNTEHYIFKVNATPSGLMMPGAERAGGQGLTLTMSSIMSWEEKQMI